MARSDKAVPAPYRELPDKQVLDTAHQYAAGYAYLIELDNEAGVVLPALHSAALALELYLKAWTADQEEFDDGSGVGIVIVKARPTSRVHTLLGLLADAPAEFRAQFLSRCLSDPRLAALGGGEAALSACEDLFLASRYPYEGKQDITKYRFDIIEACIQALRDATRDTPPMFLRR